MSKYIIEVQKLLAAYVIQDLRAPGVFYISRSDGWKLESALGPDW
jgi:hypothetical protein